MFMEVAGRNLLQHDDLGHGLPSSDGRSPRLALGAETPLLSEK